MCEPYNYFGDRLVNFRAMMVPDYMPGVLWDAVIVRLSTYVSSRVALAGGELSWAKALFITEPEAVNFHSIISSTIRACAVELDLPDVGIEQRTANAQAIFDLYRLRFTPEQINIGVAAPWIWSVEYFREDTDRVIDAIILGRAESSSLLAVHAESGFGLTWMQMLAARSAKNGERLSNLLATNKFWFHILHTDVLNTLPKEVFPEPKLDDNLSVTSPAPMECCELFFSSDGIRKDAMPEPWMLDTGCY